MLTKNITCPQPLRKKSLFLLWLTLLSGIFLVSQSFAAVKWLSFDSMLQNILNKATKDDLIKELPTKMQKGNIFSNAYELEWNNIKQEKIETIEVTANYLNKIYTKWCNMTTDDISILLFQNKDIREEIWHILQVPPMSNTEVFYETYYNACTKLNKCITPWKQPQFYQDTKMLKKCIEDTTKAYILSKTSNINMAKIQQSTQWENIFIDGNEDNWPYDLLADIQYIGDVIFKWNKERPETLFFEMPTVDMYDSNELPNNNKPQENPEWEILNWDVTNDNDLENNNDENNNDSENDNNNESTDNFVTGVKDLINWTVSKDNSKKKPTWLLLGNACIVRPDQENWDPVQSPEEIEDILQLYYTDLEKEWENLQDGVEPLAVDPDLDIIDEEVDPNDEENDDDNKDETIAIPEDIACTATCESEDNQWAKELCQVNCCVDKCKDYFDQPVEETWVAWILKKWENEKNKLICMSQCLCGEVSWPQKPLDFAWDWTPAVKYRVRFCRIPVEVQPIVPKKVWSIEEVVDEINIVLTKLKESWQLMKSVKTKEMFETSMQNIKLADVLAFNLFIKFKPIFNTMPESQAKEIQKELSEQWEQDMRNTNSLDFVEERNKYILLFNPNKRSVKKQVATNYTMQLKNIEDMEEKMSKWKSNNNNNNNKVVENINVKTKARGEALDNIANFIISNAKFWNEITETMNLMNDVASDLKVKVDKAQ